MRARLYALLEEPGGSRAAWWTSLAIQVLIALNVAAVMLGTVDAAAEHWEAALGAFEAISVALFTLEYAARLYACTASADYRAPLAGRLRYALTPLAVVDLLAILPAYLPAVVAIDFRSLRSLRLLRAVRLLKIGRYSRAVQSLGRALRTSAPELGMVAFSLAILLVLSATLLYYAEHDAQPDGFSSIPATMWWGVTTLTTVGYGDLTPVTPLGKIVASVVAILGIGLFALPAGLLGSAFVGQLSGPKRCPCCGEEL